MQRWRSLAHEAVSCRRLFTTRAQLQNGAIEEMAKSVEAEQPDPRQPSVLGNKLRTTQKRIFYPADFSKIDPILDFDHPKTLAFGGSDANQFQSLPSIPPDTTGEGLAEDETELLAKATGLTSREIKSLIQRPLVVRRVVNQTRKGKQASIYCLAVVGNGKGMVGVGEGKHTEQGTATRKAVTQAVKNMEFVQRYQERTIYGDVDYKFHAVQLRLRSRPAGFGIRANHFIYEICRCAGITDLSAKVWGSRTGMNVVKGVLEALKVQKLPSVIAQARGRRMVDVESAYYGRQN